MDKEEIQDMINQSIANAIKHHETRVGLISGVFGSFFIFGIVHAIWLMKHSMLP
jgi:hypothetical protein